MRSTYHRSLAFHIANASLYRPRDPLSFAHAIVNMLIIAASAGLILVLAKG